MIPLNLRCFFWDSDASQLNPKKDWFYIIERLLDYGDDKAIVWLMDKYSLDQIKEVVCHSRRLKQKTAFFWKNYLDLREEDIKCLHEPSPTNYWNY